MGLFSMGGMVRRIASFFTGKKGAETHHQAPEQSRLPEPVKIDAKKRRGKERRGRHERHSARGRRFGVQGPTGWLSPLDLRLKRLQGMRIDAMRAVYGRDAAAYAAKFAAPKAA